MSTDLQGVDAYQSDDREITLTQFTGPDLMGQGDRRRIQLTQRAAPGSGDMAQYLQLSPGMARELEDALRSWRMKQRPEI